MSHMSRTNLIKLAAGELPDDQRREIEAHLESCRECREAFDEHQALREILGQWQVESGAADTWPAIDRRLDEWQPTIIRPVWTKVSRISRIAAAVALGVGLGYAGGRLATHVGAVSHPAPTEVTAEEALDALGFRFIESPSATGLVTTVFELTSDAVEQGGPS
jgi:anti-sigma factor RsiW